METLKEMRQRFAKEITQSIMQQNCFDVQKVQSTIETYLSIFSKELSSIKIINYDNTLKQLTEKLRQTNSEEMTNKIKTEIKRLQKEAGAANVIINESSRDNKYRKLRKK